MIDIFKIEILFLVIIIVINLILGIFFGFMVMLICLGGCSIAIVPTVFVVCDQLKDRREKRGFE